MIGSKKCTFIFHNEKYVDSIYGKTWRKLIIQSTKNNIFECLQLAHIYFIEYVWL